MVLRPSCSSTAHCVVRRVRRHSASHGSSSQQWTNWTQAREEKAREEADQKAEADQAPGAEAEQPENTSSGGDTTTKKPAAKKTPAAKKREVAEQPSVVTHLVAQKEFDVVALHDGKKIMVSYPALEAIVIVMAASLYPLKCVCNVLPSELNEKVVIRKLVTAKKSFGQL